MPFLTAINICMREFICATLVDITETNVIRGESIERDQQRNWQSILQILSLKAQPNIIQPPQLIEEELEELNFGEVYRGKHNVWAFRFKELDYSGIYSIDDFNKTFDEIPVILGLHETARMILPIFHTSGPLNNIYFIEI